MISCRGCRGSKLEPVFEMAPMPLAGTYPATAAEARAASRWPLRWLECLTCGLVNVDPDGSVFVRKSPAGTVAQIVRGGWPGHPTRANGIRPGEERHEHLLQEAQHTWEHGIPGLSK